MVLVRSVPDKPDRLSLVGPWGPGCSRFRATRAHFSLSHAHLPEGATHTRGFSCVVVCSGLFCNTGSGRGIYYGCPPPFAGCSRRDSEEAGEREEGGGKVSLNGPGRV